MDVAGGAGLLWSRRCRCTSISLTLHRMADLHNVVTSQKQLVE